MYKTFLKVLGILLILIAAILMWALKTVDYTPYFHTDYYKKTRTLLDSLLESKVLRTGDLELGFGKASITPVTGAESTDVAEGKFISVPLAGYGNRDGAPMEGIHDSIYVKSVAIRVGDRLLFLVSADLLIMPPGVTELVADILADKTDISRSQLFLSATHTHSSVGGFSKGTVGEAFGGPFDADMVDFLSYRISEAVKQSMKDLQPGRMGTGVFKAPGYVRNRLVGELGTKNGDFLFVVLQQQDGTKAILGSFAGHATTLGAWNMEISGDYPGFWQRRIEENGVDMGVFYAGSVGSHSVRGGQGEGFERSKSIGIALADSILKFSETVELSGESSLAFLTVDMNLPPLHVRVSDGLRLNEWLAGKLFPPIGTPTIQAARIGNLIWATTPCDFSGESALLLSNMVAKEGFNGLVTSFNGAYVGYIVPCRYYHLNEYETRLMSWFGPYMGPYTQEILRRMMLDLAQSGNPAPSEASATTVREAAAAH